MKVSASIRQGRSLLHYGEFDSFEAANVHLTAMGWECTKTTNNGVTYRWEYVKGAEILELKEIKEDA